MLIKITISITLPQAQTNENSPPTIDCAYKHLCDRSGCFIKSSHPQAQDEHKRFRATHQTYQTIH